MKTKLNTRTAQGHYFTGPKPGFPGGGVCSTLVTSIRCYISLIARIHGDGSKNQGMEMVEEPLTATSSDPLAKILLPVPVTVSSAGLEVLVSKGGMHPPGTQQ